MEFRNSYFSMRTASLVASLMYPANSFADTTTKESNSKTQSAPIVLLQTDLNIPLMSDGDLLAAVTSYANTVAVESGVGTQSRIVYASTQPSLRGLHFRFNQMIGANPVFQRQLVVSVVADTRVVFQVYNNLKPDPTTKQSESPSLLNLPSGTSLSSKRLARLSLAWESIGGAGGLLSAPTEIIGLTDDMGSLTVDFPLLRLVAKVSMATTNPMGDWIVTIDPVTHSVLHIENQILNLNPKTVEVAKQSVTRVSLEQALKNQAQFERARQISISKTKTLPSQGLPTATALVFDPDPLTVLRNDELTDTSTEDLFADAYKQVELFDMSVSDGGVYSLVGPWVKLIDFESPNVAPATSESTEWTSLRGKLPFNDTMTYHHLDQSQRYMQSLGFVGERGIQHLSIEVDANGVSGQDNSHFIPSVNRLAFGHGCVDDNEDADVILHEYGHAIQRSIVPDWTSGDTGAMGEGFGDYWAASYSFKVLGPEASGLNKVFNWDGVADCWPGRILDATALMYDHSRSYGAHSPMGTGRSTDELWSTPLFQSLLTLASMGVDSSEVDRIVLESHFGLGARVKMRDLALATLNSARMLYPAGPHAGVLMEKFRAQKIIE